MTRPAMHNAKCQHCDIDGICPECGEKISLFSPFSDWLRALPAPLDSSRISNQNLDYIWHNYVENWFITMEEKQMGAKCPPAQWDTHGILYLFLRFASDVLGMAKGRIMAGINSKRGLREVQYRGHYVISFENTTPDDSEWIRINKEKRDKVALLELLKTGEIPDESPPRSPRPEFPKPHRSVG